MEKQRSVNPFNVAYAIITGIIYIIVAKGFGSGIEFIRALAVSLLDFIGGFAGLGDTFYSQNQGNLLATDPYFWFIFFMIGSIFSVGITYYLSDEGTANKLYAAMGTTFAQLIIGRIVTVQRVTIPVQLVLVVVAIGFYFLHCEKLHKNATLIILAPMLIPVAELIIILPFVFVASKLPSILAIVIAFIGFVFAVFICYPMLSSFYYKNILRIDSSISNFNIIWVVGVLVFCLVFGNQPQGSAVYTDGMEYHNSIAENLFDMLCDFFEWAAGSPSDGESDQMEDWENVDSTKETDTYSSTATDISNESNDSDSELSYSIYPEATVEKKLVYKNSDIEVTSLNLKREVINDYANQPKNVWDRIVLTVQIINKMNEEKDFQIVKNVVLINDSVTATAYFENKITEGSKITADIIIDTDNLNEFGIQKIGDLKFRINTLEPIIENGEETGTFEYKNETGVIDVRTSMFDQADTNLSLEDATVFCQANGIRIIGRYEDSFGKDGEAGILMLVDNNSGQDISVNFDNMAINNKMLEWFSSIQPSIVFSGTKAISFYETEQPFEEKLMIEDVNEIEFSLDIRSEETWDSIVLTDTMKLVQLEPHEWMISG